jgi:cell division protein ZipA
MNELQQVLLVFAVIVVIGLYFFSRQRSQKNKAPKPSTPEASHASLKQKLADDLLPSSMPKQPVTSLADKPSPSVGQAKTQEELDFESRQQLLQFDDTPITPTQRSQAPKVHKVIEIDDLELVDERFVGRYQPAPTTATNRVAEVEAPAQPEKIQSASPRMESKPEPDPQIFAILVLFTQTDMSVNRLMSHLKIFGLVYDERGIYVKKANGRTVVKVANVMEPGLFPAEPDDTMKTPGIALILELPSSIPAPGAMEELIMTARRISQALEGRMYDMQRHLLRESDIQAMREAALDFETVKL